MEPPPCTVHARKWSDTPLKTAELLRKQRVFHRAILINVFDREIEAEPIR
jgi:hypothetical protein